MSVTGVIWIVWIRLDGLVMGILGMECSDGVSAHVEVEVVWSAHVGSPVVDGRNGERRGMLSVQAIKRVVAGAGAVIVAIVVVVVVLGVAMGVVLVVLVFYLHLFVAVVVVGAWLLVAV